MSDLEWMLPDVVQMLKDLSNGSEPTESDYLNLLHRYGDVYFLLSSGDFNMVMAYYQLQVQRDSLLTTCESTLGWLEEAAKVVYDPQNKDEGMNEVIADLKAAIGQVEGEGGV